jgi:quercetin dioxygenase-like cupin family protein
MEITKVGAKPSFKGPKEWFTGNVWADALFDANESRKGAGTHVRFEPGARTVWHTHPLGQTLIITSGSGWVQREGGPIEEVHAGDVVWFEANEKHWHGATATNGMSHIAVQENLNGKMVDWMEEVTAEQYGSSK